jgi:predicted O-methyltransferase YrrM
MDLVPEELGRYVEAHTSAASPLLAELERETRETLDAPQMLSGPVEGRFLEFLVSALQARSVLEIGTYSGYSALSMARGLPSDGRIVTLELNPAHAEVARRYIARSPHAEQIEVVVGPAMESLAALAGPFDFVFIDADKGNYWNYYEAALAKLAPGGMIAADNTLWSGRVVEEPGPDDESLRAIQAFNEKVVSDPRVHSVILTVRDGVTLIRHAG